MASLKKFLQIIPIPVCGLMLGVAALGNLLRLFFSEIISLDLLGNILHSICGVIASAVWIIVILKIIFCFREIITAMNNPVLASVFGTFPMATMILCGYAHKYIGIAAEIIWFAALSLQIAIIIWFTIRFILHFSLKNIYASCFIAYAGIAVAAVSAPEFNLQAVGTISFWIGLTGLLAILIPIIVRYIKIPVEEPFKPLFCIFAAPFALYLCAYLECFVPNQSIVIFMTAAAVVFFVLVLIKLPKLLKLRFYPSYAAFTFPFVISATASLHSALFLAEPLMVYITAAETLIASVMVIYSFTRYTIALSKQITA